MRKRIRRGHRLPRRRGKPHQEKSFLKKEFDAFCQLPGPVQTVLIGVLALATCHLTNLQILVYLIAGTLSSILTIVLSVMEMNSFDKLYLLLITVQLILQALAMGKR
jgi:hypothetical protein